MLSLHPGNLYVSVRGREDNPKPHGPPEAQRKRLPAGLEVWQAISSGWKMEVGMDKQAAATFGGVMAVMSEFVRLFVNKGLVTPDELRDVATELDVRGREQGAETGFDAAPVHLLSVLENWKAGPRPSNSRP